MFKYCVIFFVLVIFNQVTCDNTNKSISVLDYESDSHLNDSDIIHEYYDEAEYTWEPFKGKNYLYCFI